MINVENMTVQYKDKPVLNNLSVHFPTGSITGLVAPNGTGKSTLLNALMNYVPLTGGMIKFGEEGLAYRSVKNETMIHERISLMPDQSDLFDYLSGRDHLKMYQKMWPKTALAPATIIAQLRMDSYVDKRVGEYSLGMRQRLCFAMQIVSNTQYMLMDEVMNGLDPTNVALISEVLLEKRAEGKTVIIASHLLENLEFISDLILFLKDGDFIYRQDQTTAKNNVLLFKEMTEKLSLWQAESGAELTQIANGKVYLPLDHYSVDELSDIITSLLQSGIQQFELGNLSLEDRYALYYE